MRRFQLPLALALLAVALVAVPAALAKDRHHRADPHHRHVHTAVDEQLKLSREDGRIEVEFQVDQNQSDVPWTVTISRNGTTFAPFTATTRAPSGALEVRRFIRGRLGADRITVVATMRLGRDLHRGLRRGPADHDHDDDHARSGPDRHDRRQQRRRQRRRRSRAPLRQRLLSTDR